MKQIIRAITIDNESASSSSLAALLRLSYHPVEILGQAISLIEGMKLIKKFLPDILFIDAIVENKPSFDLFEILDTSSILTIFVADHEKYAHQAFQVGAANYLLKPIKLADLNLALDKLVSHTPKKRMWKQAEEHGMEQQISIPTEGKYEIHNIRQIVRLSAIGNYSRIYFENGTEKIATKTLKHFELILSNHGFLRINRQDLVRMDLVSKVSKGRYPILELKNGEELKASDRKRSVVRQYLIHLQSQ